VERIGFLREVVVERIGRLKPVKGGSREVAIRFRLRLSRGSHSVDVVALVKSGYETVEPEILVPLVTARELHVYPELPYGAAVREYRLADGSTTKLIRIPGTVNVYVLKMIGL
jgi:hypothetical protein